MPIPMFGSAGDLFNRIGKLGNIIKLMRAHQASQQTAMIDTTNGVVAQYDAESDIQAMLGSSYIGLLNSFGVNIGSITQQMAVATVNRMVFRDNPLINLTLEQQNTTGALQEIIKQMRDQGETVLAMTIGATPTTFTGTGNGIIVASTKRPSDGKVLENCLAETVLFTVISDSYSGSATAGGESIQINGVGSNNDPFSFNWPLGSDAVTSVTVIDGNSDASGGNELTNSGYEDWTDNEPDNNVVTVGAGGTNIFRENSIIYDGSFALRVTGDASGTLVEWYQEFDDDEDGTVSVLSPQTQYAYNIFLRRGGSAITGSWEAALVDSNGDIVEDENGVQNVLTVNLADLTATYTAFNTTFRTPAIMPDPIRLRRRFTTAMANGGLFYADKEALGQMTQLYTSGPYFAVFAGSVPFLIGDFGTCAITNSRGSGGTLATFQTLWDNLFGMRSLDLLLPSSATPSISDSLIG